MAIEAFFAKDFGRVDAVFAAVRAAAPSACFKAILETGDPRYTPQLLGRAADRALDAGADFLKTSTGKVPVGATSEALEVLCDAIGWAPVGVKVSGGIRTRETALTFVDIVRHRPAFESLTPRRFRIGASDLFTQLHSRART
jgi:deoxyribose-phosphate aldolase